MQQLRCIGIAFLWLESTGFEYHGLERIGSIPRRRQLRAAYPFYKSGYIGIKGMRPSFMYLYITMPSE